MLNLNEEHFPLVYVKSVEDVNEINEEIFEEYKVFYLKLLLRCKNENKKMILISNLSDLKTYPMEYVMKQVEFTKKINDFNKKYVECIIILYKNESFKHIFNIFTSFVKPVCKYKLCKSFEKINKYLIDNYEIHFDLSIFKEKNNINNVNTIHDEGNKEEKYINDLL
jgi:hypothetical protein